MSSSPRMGEAKFERPPWLGVGVALEMDGDDLPVLLVLLPLELRSMTVSAAETAPE